MLIGNTTSSAMRARRPARLPSCDLMKTWRKSCATCRGAARLFPYMRTVRSGDRATEFKQRCDWTWHQRRLAAQLPLRVGRTGKNGGLSRTVCPGESWPQQQGHDAGIFPEGSGGNAVVKRIRAATEGHYWKPQPRTSGAKRRGIRRTSCNLGKLKHWNWKRRD